MTLGAGAESRTDRAAGQKRGPVERVEAALLHGVVEDRKHVGSEAAARLSLEPCANFHIFHMKFNIFNRNFHIFPYELPYFP